MRNFATRTMSANALSIVAFEEASRLGQRVGDLDHLFLALVLTGEPAGQALRSMGIGMDAARRAVGELHSSQLALLGIDADPPQAGPIVFHETGGYKWHERALAVLSLAESDDPQGDYSAAVLRRLVDEPSGLIASLLGHLGTTPEAVRERLAELSPSGPEHTPPAATNALAGSATAFVPAPLEEVWALLIDPGRMRDWGPCFGQIEYGQDASGALPGDVWTGVAPTHRPDGTPLRVGEAVRRQRIELLERDERRSIAWRFSYPDRPGANSRRVGITLEPVPGGCRLRTTLVWERDPGRTPRRLLGLLFRPLHRWAVSNQLAHIGLSIGRVFR